jgi:hypothetical protein
MNRFDIADRKGLEITLLTTLLTFQDPSTANNTPSAESSVPSPPVQAEAAPPLPPRPAPKTGVDRVAEMHAMRYEPNEVTVDGEGSVENYGEYAEGLLAVRHTRCPVRPLSDIEPATGRCDAVHHRSIRLTRRRTKGPASS